MEKSKLLELAEVGQSIWLDSISRSMIEKGELRAHIDQGLMGLTSNPTIFEKAIGQTADYDQLISDLSKQGKSNFEIYDALTIKDIQDAADLFSDVYQATNRKDGYVSLEINPKLAFNTEESIKEAKRLFKAVNRPNLMMKIPATKNGYEVVETLVGEGINVNTTLIFSSAQYTQTALSYIRGLESYLDKGGDLSKVHSVASVFVSRIDSAVDGILVEKYQSEKDFPIRERLSALQGEAAVANSLIIFSEYCKIFLSNEFKNLEEKGAATQRVLWASTSTKNPKYDDLKYVTNLIASPTVNTLPKDTLEAFKDHGKIGELLTDNAVSGENIFKSLGTVGVSMDEIFSKLLTDGIEAFEKSFDSLIATIDEKIKVLV